MKLQDWLDERRMSHADFAQRIRRDRSSVTRYCNGRMPGKDDLALIANETDGAVTANDWIEPAAGPAQAAE